MAVTLLLACGGQLWSIARTGAPLEAGRAVGGGLQPLRVGLPVYLLHLLLGYEVMSTATPWLHRRFTLFTLHSAATHGPTQRSP